MAGSEHSLSLNDLLGLGSGTPERALEQEEVAAPEPPSEPSIDLLLNLLGGETSKAPAEPLPRKDAQQEAVVEQVPTQPVTDQVVAEVASAGHVERVMTGVVTEYVPPLPRVPFAGGSAPAQEAVAASARAAEELPVATYTPSPMASSAPASQGAPVPEASTALQVEAVAQQNEAELDFLAELLAIASLPIVKTAPTPPPVEPAAAASPAAPEETVAPASSQAPGAEPAVPATPITPTQSSVSAESVTPAPSAAEFLPAMPAVPLHAAAPAAADQGSAIPATSAPAQPASQPSNEAAEKPQLAEQEEPPTGLFSKKGKHAGSRKDRRAAKGKHATEKDAAPVEDPRPQQQSSPAEQVPSQAMPQLEKAIEQVQRPAAETTAPVAAPAEAAVATPAPTPVSAGPAPQMAASAASVAPAESRDASSWKSAAYTVPFAPIVSESVLRQNAASAVAAAASASATSGPVVQRPVAAERSAQPASSVQADGVADAAVTGSDAVTSAWLALDRSELDDLTRLEMLRAVRSKLEAEILELDRMAAAAQKAPASQQARGHQVPVQQASPQQPRQAVAHQAAAQSAAPHQTPVQQTVTRQQPRQAMPRQSAVQQAVVQRAAAQPMAAQGASKPVAQVQQQRQQQPHPQTGTQRSQSQAAPKQQVKPQAQPVQKPQPQAKPQQTQPQPQPQPQPKAKSQVHPAQPPAQNTEWAPVPTSALFPPAAKGKPPATRSSLSPTPPNEKEEPLLGERPIPDSPLFNTAPASLADGLREGAGSHVRHLRMKIALGVTGVLVVVALFLGAVFQLSQSGTPAVPQDSDTPAADAQQQDNDAQKPNDDAKKTPADDSQNTTSEQDLSGTVVYRYRQTAGPDAPSTVERTTFGEDGLCRTSSLEITFNDEAEAADFLDTLKRDYGTAFLDGKVDGTRVTALIDVGSNKLDRDQYERALRASVSDLSVVKKS
ncbi:MULTISPECIES: hypothetical protein [Gordonibacter]|uniref:Uncharacterized protein n=1 Tax=Gordonibacter faecis TaxID=3047475 RepID=A0ABT7DNF8_9ACTN|nr:MULTISPECIES: hypothetical protein [unclassified Gordonibacter]MDJ1650086.1 hypothetical protein [Gordonibacter sp. KGMB12511]HIW75531.1 hypothetical protein [Candidatus Gordonibacter avicola]